MSDIPDAERKLLVEKAGEAEVVIPVNVDERTDQFQLQTRDSSEELLQVEPAAEQGEKVELKDMQFFHIDDEPYIHNGIQELLAKHFGVAKRLGTAQHADLAIENIKELADQGQRIDMVLLDQSFFEQDGDGVESKRASKIFVSAFATLLQDPDYMHQLKDSKILMCSGSADDKYMKQMQEICPAVIGLVQKGMEETMIEGFQREFAAVGYEVPTDFNVE